MSSIALVHDILAREAGEDVPFAEILRPLVQMVSEGLVDPDRDVTFKLIGDAVLFVFDDPEPAARLALDLVESFGGDQPELRVGLTHGSVLSRLGDLFGPPVNLASRLVSYARPGSVLVDQLFLDRIGEVDDLRFRSIRPRDLKGIGTTALYVLRRDER